MIVCAKKRLCCCVAALCVISALTVPKSLAALFHAPPIALGQGRALRGSSGRDGQSSEIKWQPVYHDDDNDPPRPISEEDGPWHASWSNSVALCSVAKKENATDVIEWLQYYRWLGVDKVYLTENDAEALLREALQPFVDTGFLVYQVEEQPQAQLNVFSRCLRQHRHQHNWMAFFDVDEFLVLRNPKDTLKGVLDEFKYFPGLLVHWIMVGPSGRKTRPSEGGVLRHYQRCDASPRPMVKIIGNMYYTVDITWHPHNMRFRGQGHPVNEKHEAMPYRYGANNGLCPKQEETPRCHLSSGSVMPKSKVSAERLALFHYSTKSAEDFRIKQARAGGINSMPKPQTFFDTWARDANESGGVCAEAAPLADLCCSGGM